MSRNRGNRTIRISIQMSKLIPVLLWHRLYLKCKHTKLVEHRSHTVRQHTKVLSTTKHSRSTKHISYLAYSLPAPEEVMTLIIIVIIQSHKRILLLCCKRIKHGFADNPDTRMIHLRLLRVFQEQYTTYQPIQSVTNPQTIFVCPPIKSFLHLFLGIIFRLNIIQSVTTGHKEMFADIWCMQSEKPIQHPVVDKRTSEKILSERQSEVLYLTYCHRQRWREMSQYSEYCIFWNLPYTEETKDMVYTYSIEILFHPFQSTMEPLYQTRLPVISWKSPVLSILRECIRWRTCLCIKMVELRMCSRLNTIAIYPYGHITFYEYTL